jgi:hypothetical protein
VLPSEWFREFSPRKQAFFVILERLLALPDFQILRRLRYFTTDSLTTSLTSAVLWKLGSGPQIGSGRVQLDGDATVCAARFTDTLVCRSCAFPKLAQSAPVDQTDARNACRELQSVSATDVLLPDHTGVRLLH